MFAHLHCHFLGSYSDSLLDPGRDLSYIKEMGQKAVAITDHGVLDYCYPFYWSCRRVGLHPVLGCEVYFVDDAAKSIETNDSYRNHLILLARDNDGFRNLVRLVNRSWLENNFGETRGLVDWKLLEEFHDGLIALSGCFWGSLPQKYITGGMEEAEKEFRRYYDIFGRDFYPELGRHEIADEEKANEGLIALSKRFGVPPVVTNDSHYRQARGEFVLRLKKLSDEFGVKLPLGNKKDVVIAAGRNVIKKAGMEALVKVGKIHFKTTKEILAVG